MRLKDFIQSIDDKTPVMIIRQRSIEQLQKGDVKISLNCCLWRVLEGAKLEGIGGTDKGLSLLFSKDGQVFGLDWYDGCGATLCEYIPPEPLVYGDNVVSTDALS